MVGQDGSSWRLSLDVASSRGLAGGHPEEEGVTADGRVINVSEHAHRVELDLTRYEAGLSRTFDERWDAFVRVAWFVKEQKADVLFEEGTPAEDQDAAIRSGRNHHRSAVYKGFSDIEAGVGWRKRDILGEGTVFRLSLGLALPSGDYEREDPLRAGDEGKEHLHIQFGNGTLDPVADFYLGIPVAKKWAFSLYGKGRFPFYANSAGFHGGVEGMLIPRLTWLATKNFSISGGVAGNYYGYSEWSDRRDPNSGQFAVNASLSLGYKFNEHLTGSVSALLPLYTKTFSGGDSLDPAPTFSVSAAWTF